MSASIFEPRRLSVAKRSELLRGLLASARPQDQGGAPVLVFDLDGTLFDNRARVERIFHELAADWQTKHPDDARKLAAARTSDIVYGLHENLNLLGVTDALQEEAFAYWKARFFIDDYIRYDEPIAGAREFVVSSYDGGATVVYLTGRDLPNMALGTFASLRDHGFPIGVVGTCLITKPDFETPDADFKRAVAPALSRHGRVVAVFDNEPANCNLLLEHHPKCTSVFLDTHHAPNPPTLDERVPVIDTFEHHV